MLGCVSKIRDSPDQCWCQAWVLLVNFCLIAQKLLVILYRINANIFKNCFIMANTTHFTFFYFTCTIVSPEGWFSVYTMDFISASLMWIVTPKKNKTKTPQKNHLKIFHLCKIVIHIFVVYMLQISGCAVGIFQASKPTKNYAQQFVSKSTS